MVLLYSKNKFENNTEGKFEKDLNLFRWTKYQKCEEWFDNNYCRNYNGYFRTDNVLFYSE